MGLFGLKFDIKNDSLTKLFHPDKGYYFIKLFEGQRIEVGIDKLNRRSLRELKRINLNLSNDKELYDKELQQYKALERSRKLASLGYTCNCFECFGMTDGTISSPLKEELEDLVSQDDVLIGIHRTKDSTTLEDIADVLSNGLIIFGHMGGGVSTPKSLSNTVSYYPDNRTILKEIVCARTYKNSSGSILLRIPDEDLKDPNKVYFHDDDNNLRVRPKYILGYLPVFDDRHVDRMYTKDDILELTGTKRENKTVVTK